MPIYAYKCESCGFAKDVLQKLSDPHLTQCPSCGAPAFRKQLTAAGFQLKGSGWYATDFKDAGNKKPQPAGDQPAAQAATGSESKSEGGDHDKNGKSEGESAAESKPAAKKADAPAAKAPDAKPAAGSGT